MIKQSAVLLLYARQERQKRFRGHPFSALTNLYSFFCGTEMLFKRKFACMKNEYLVLRL